MLQLPKKRPWIIILIFYMVIIGGWIAFYILAENHSGNKRTPEEAEAWLKQQQEEPATPPATPPTEPPVNPDESQR